MAKNPSIVHSAFGAKLSPQLVKEHHVRSMSIRKGDSVIIRRGAFRDVEGKVTQANHKHFSICVEGVTKEKADGTTMFVLINPSNVMITKLNLDDKWRKSILERRVSTFPIETVEKPKSKVRKKSSKKSVSVAEKEDGE
ncbi:MAG: 50S ribosomal protein L24 [Candidatus Bathyarchaeota archaeon]